MLPLRFLVYLTPIVMMAVAWWSAEIATRTRAQRHHELIISTRLPLPSLNPFAPQTALERELCALLYEPLLSLDDSGQFSPKLAASWDWNQRVSLWFESPEMTTAAAEHLRSLDADRWISMGLTAVNTDGNTLQLQFEQPNGAGPDEALAELTDHTPLPIQLVRLQINQAAGPHHQHFLQHATEASHFRRVWQDQPNTLDFAICGAPGNALDELQQYYRARPELKPRITQVATAASIREPILDWRLETESRWPDQSPVTSEDVRATIEYLKKNPPPSAMADSLALIQSIETPSPQQLTLHYRRFRSSSLAAWVGLPIIPKSWVESRESGADTGPLTDLPPGSGPFRPGVKRSERWVFDAVEPDKRPFGRIRLQGSPSAMHNEFAIATGSIDCFWPEAEIPPLHDSSSRFDIHATPASSRLMLVWNTQSPAVSSSEMRRALSRAIDREALLRQLPQIHGRPYDSFFPPQLWFSDQQPHLPPDPQTAETVLSKNAWLPDALTGIRKNAQGSPLSIRLLTTAGNPLREQLGRWLAQQWAQIGVEVDLQTLPPHELTTRALDREPFDAVILGVDLDLTWDLFSYWHSTQTPPRGRNFSGLNDPELDLLLEAATQETAPEQIANRVAAIDKRLRQLCPAFTLMIDAPPIVLRHSRQTDDLKTPFSLSQFLMSTSHKIDAQTH
jgi:ABC-type transport system substrate-binding protein